MVPARVKQAQRLSAWDHGVLLTLLERGASTLCVDPGSHWENVCGESFNGEPRDELLDREVFGILLQRRSLRAGGGIAARRRRHRHLSSIASTRKDARAGRE